MQEIRDLICIGCPMGCQLSVTLENGVVSAVAGNTCKIGDNYARKEVTSPTRIVTSTVAIEGAAHPRVPVKTASDIPKSAIFDVMAAIRCAHVTAPVKVGDIVIPDVAGTGVNVVAARSMEHI